MGGRTITCPVDILNHTSQVNGGDSLLNLRSRSYYPFRDWLPKVEKGFFDPSNNNGLLEKSLDLIEERRENAMVQLAYYQHKLKQGYDANVN